jgi:hypothetical protein
MKASNKFEKVFERDDSWRMEIRRMFVSRYNLYFIHKLGRRFEKECRIKMKNREVIENDVMDIIC